MSLALTAFWYTVSNAATVCASRVGGGGGSGVEGMCVLGEAAATLCFGKANGGAVSDRRESSGGVGIGTIVLWASGCLACCSDVRVAVCSGARVAVCCGTAVGVSCAADEGLCSGAGVGGGVAGAGVRSGVGVAVCCGVGVGVCSALGVAVTAGVGARVAFLRGASANCTAADLPGFLATLTKVACNLFPLAST